MIRKATIEDIWRIQKIVHTTWIPTYTPILTEPQIYYMTDMMYSTASLERQMYKGQEFYLYFGENDNCKGYISFQMYLESSTLKIHKIYVDLSYQGEQIGRQLMDFAEFEATRRGLSTLSLNVNKYNKAIGFYEKLGYMQVDAEDIDIGRGYIMEDYVMSKQI